MAKASRTAAKAPVSELKVIDCIQGSEDWLRARLGIPTASNFATVTAGGRDGGPSLTRTKLLHRLAGEIITGEPAPDEFRSAAMERGNALEAEALESYCRRKNVESIKIGLVRNFSGLRACAASPDALLGFDGGVEVKTAAAHILIPLLQKPTAAMPPEHRPQVQGCMWVCERDWWDITIYCHRSMPAVDVRVYRDEQYIKELSNEVERFNFDLKRLVEQLKNMGQAG